MRFTVSSSALSSKLNMLAKVIGSKNSLPILDCFLFTLLFLGFYGLDCLFCRFFCKIRNSSCQFLIEFLHSHFLLLLKFFINLL